MRQYNQMVQTYGSQVADKLSEIERDLQTVKLLVSEMAIIDKASEIIARHGLNTYECSAAKTRMRDEVSIALNRLDCGHLSTIAY